MTLTTAQISRLRSLAQKLESNIKVGKQGLSEPFLATVRDALARRELIKVKFDDFKDQRKVLAPELAAKTESVLVTLIGNVAVLYRQNENPEKRQVAL